MAQAVAIKSRVLVGRVEMGLYAVLLAIFDNIVAPGTKQRAD